MLLRFAHHDGTVLPTPAVAKATPRAGARAGVTTAIDVGGELLPLLHSTLDVATLLRLFARVLGRRLGHGSVTFVDVARGLEVCVGRRARHDVGAELVVDNQELGTITLTRATPFTAQDARVLEAWLRHLVLPLRNALLYHDAVQASLKDTLTGLHNRTYFDTTLRLEVGLAHRHATALSLIVLDIDRFEAINDARGHHAGDVLLQQVALRLASCARTTDVLARYGGDEFALALASTPPAGAIVLARRILDGLARAPVDVAGGTLRLEATLGVAGLRKQEAPEQLFRRADAARCEARRAGANLGIASGQRCRAVRHAPRR